MMFLMDYNRMLMSNDNNDYGDDGCGENFDDIKFFSQK